MICDPLFVFGIARSGTNLVAGMLNARNDVGLALDPLMPYFKALRGAILAARGDAALSTRFPERAAFQDCYFDPFGVRLLDANMSGSLELPLNADAELAQAVAQRAALESRTLPDELARVRGDTFAAFLSGVLQSIRTRSSAPLRWCGTKEVWTTEFIPVLARSMPHALFIAIRRDPRAIIASLVAMMRKDETQTAHTISYMRHWRKEAAVIDAIGTDPSLRGRVLTVQYEAITSAPERAARDMCAFLDVPFDRAMLAPASTDGSPSPGNSSFGDLSGIVDTSIARWRQFLDDDTVHAIECLCGPEMRAEGYETINAWPILPNSAVNRAVMQADANPGSWRSDGGGTDLAPEQTRWDLLTGNMPHSKVEIRRHFLFESLFDKLRAATSQRPVAAAVGAR